MNTDTGPQEPQVTAAPGAPPTMDKARKAEMLSRPRTNMYVDRDIYTQLLAHAISEGISVPQLMRDILSEHYTAPPEPQPEPPITVISWVNNTKQYQDNVLQSMVPEAGFQEYTGEVHFVVIQPDFGARNIGAAYEAGRKASAPGIKVYIHQDAGPLDPFFLSKIASAFAAGASGVGVIGSMVDTGSAWFYAPSFDYTIGYVEPPTGQVVGSAEHRVKLVDGFVFATNAELPWCEDYLGPHMAVEDMCKRIEAAGGQVWTISTQFIHQSPGTIDEDFWRSCQIFRDKWWPTLPPDLPSLEELRTRSISERAELGIDMHGKPTGGGMMADVERWHEGRAELARLRLHAGSGANNGKARTGTTNAGAEGPTKWDFMTPSSTPSDSTPSGRPQPSRRQRRSKQARALTRSRAQDFNRVRSNSRKSHPAP